MGMTAPLPLLLLLLLLYFSFPLSTLVLPAVAAAALAVPLSILILSQEDGGVTQLLAIHGADGHLTFMRTTATSRSFLTSMASGHGKRRWQDASNEVSRGGDVITSARGEIRSSPRWFNVYLRRKGYMRLEVKRHTFNEFAFIKGYIGI
uniref:Uncharacterized protein n=1 Tax=Oryza glaberrima TaxID=4538 RepID=I1R6D6_ORYGL